MWLAMYVQISGGRADGTQWPPAYVPYEFPDGEGEDLLRGGHAYRVDPPARGDAAPEPGPAPELPGRETVFRDDVDQAVTGLDAVAAGLPPGPEAPGEPEALGLPDGLPGAPKPADPKQAWVDFAMTQGATEDEANSVTKADLMSRYGGRL